MKNLRWRKVRQELSRVKVSRWVAVLVVLSMMLGLVTAVSAVTYTVKQGDTLYSISRRNNTTVSELAATNNIANPNVIQVGQQLEIPTNVQAAPAAAEMAVNNNPPAPTYSEPNTTYAPSTTPYDQQTQTYGYQTQTYGYQNQAYGQSTTYVVQRGDTLYRIAQRYGVSVAAISQANNIVNVHQIQVGQVLVIPTPNYQPPLYDLPSIVHPFDYSEPTVYIPSTLPDAPNTPATTETDPDVGGDYACTRFNFATGRDRYRGSMEGLYIMKDVSGSQIASWYAYTGEIDSGWINELPIAFDSVNIRVIFIPAYGGGPPIQMEIVNPVGSENYGWLTRGLCHAVEIQYPAGY